MWWFRVYFFVSGDNLELLWSDGTDMPRPLAWDNTQEARLISRFIKPLMPCSSWGWEIEANRTNPPTLSVRLRNNRDTTQVDGSSLGSFWKFGRGVGGRRGTGWESGLSSHLLGLSLFHLLIMVFLTSDVETLSSGACSWSYTITLHRTIGFAGACYWIFFLLFFFFLGFWFDFDG